MQAGAAMVGGSGSWGGGEIYLCDKRIRPLSCCF